MYSLQLKMKHSIIYIFILFISCNLTKVPKKRLSQYQLDNKYEFINDRLEVRLNNTLQCPIRIWILSKDIKLKAHFDTINPITLKPLEDSVINVETNNVNIKEVVFASRLGDINEIVNISKVELPFQKYKEYRFVQGYNSSPTHNTDWSRYAMDFGLAIGDTICSATSGYVVGVIEDHKRGGVGSEWKNFGNFITIYDQSTGLYTRYAHLKYKGSFVSVGDKIEVGQAIGLAGMTGQTNIEHLHFNCLKPIYSQDGLISIPLDSIGEYRISEMKRNDLIINKN